MQISGPRKHRNTTSREPWACPVWERTLDPWPGCWKTSVRTADWFACGFKSAEGIIFSPCPLSLWLFNPVPTSTRPLGGRVHYLHAAAEASYDVPPVVFSSAFFVNSGTGNRSDTVFRKRTVQFAGLLVELRMSADQHFCSLHTRAKSPFTAWWHPERKAAHAKR